MREYGGDIHFNVLKLKIWLRSHSRIMPGPNVQKMPNRYHDMRNSFKTYQTS